MLSAFGWRLTIYLATATKMWAQKRTVRMPKLDVITNSQDRRGRDGSNEALLQLKKNVKQLSEDVSRS